MDWFLYDRDLLHESKEIPIDSLRDISFLANLRFTCSNSTKETPEQCVIYIQC